MTQVPPLLTTAQVAERFSVSLYTVQRWAREGLFPAIRLPGGTLRFRLEDVEKVLNDSLVDGAA